MALSQLIGTDLDRIAQSTHKVPGYRVLLFDIYQDTISDITLNTYTQVPLDLTSYCLNIDLTISHDTEANQATFNFAGELFDWRLLTYSWVKVFEGDLRVDKENWPNTFSGVFRGQPTRRLERGNLYTYTHTAYDRSVFYRDRRTTSGRVWEPFESDVDLGSIVREFATNSEWGMNLDPAEVLFGQFGTRIKKRLQIVDVSPMKAITEIMQVVNKQPAFNGEGKLVARDVDLDRLPIRIYDNTGLIKSVDLPSQPRDLPSSVTVKGLDYRLTKVEKKVQKIFDVGPITVGMFTPEVEITKSFDEEGEFRVEINTEAQNVKFSGQLLGDIFKLDSKYEIILTQIDDFNVNIRLRLRGAEEAIAIVVGLLVAYFVLEAVAAALGSTFGFLGWIIEAGAIILLQLIMQTLRGLGKVSFEIWGKPFEYAYLELEAKARLSDVAVVEDQGKTVENYILSTLDDCADIAKLLLRRNVAEVASRDVSLSTDQLIEPNDILELEEDEETARYYVLEVNRTLSRESEPTMSISTFRAK